MGIPAGGSAAPVVGDVSAHLGTLDRMDLSGDWLATVADDDVRRFGLGVDDRGLNWEHVRVPGHWRDHPAFAESDGPIMYRRSFSAPAPEEDRRRWVTFDGLFYQADVWLDSAYLGDPEGYFAPHAFDVTALSGIGDDHVLAVEVTCAPQHGPQGRRNITGVFQQWGGLASGWNPGGIWREVELSETGPVRIDRLRLLCRDADERRAHLRIATRLDSSRQTTVTVRTSLDGQVRDEQEHAIAEGLNELEWTVDVPDPRLWWPRMLGERELTEVTVEIVVDGECSDSQTRRTGLRQVTWNSWVCAVNGERLFLKGANALPTNLGLARVTDDDVRADVQSAVELGLDALRVEGHIAHPELYRAADELGILLLQDFPLQWGHARSVRRQAVDQARQAVDLLGHHPSIIQWNAHNDPSARSAEDEANGWWGRSRRMAAEQLPTWNRSVLDRWVKRSFERSDPTRAAIAHSGVAPHLPQLDGTDSHLSFGWRKGDATDIARFASRLPRMVRFVSAFGADSAPTQAEFLRAAESANGWPDLDWERLAVENGYDRAVFERRLPPEAQPDLEEWVRLTQHYQSHVLKVQIETLRRLKYRPTGGFCFSRLADPAPAISASILDHRRTPKAAYDVVAAACAPVLVVATQPSEQIEVGASLDLDVHVISDLRAEIEFAVVDAVVTWPGGEERFRFGGPVPADEVVLVGAVEVVVPDVTGELTVDLTMTAGTLESHNHYRTTVIPATTSP